MAFKYTEDQLNKMDKTLIVELFLGLLNNLGLIEPSVRHG